MEEVEASLLEGGIGWLAETILENLETDSLGEWIRRVGLADDTEKLRSEIERVEVVVAALRGRAAGNKPLARSLSRLRELLYDADDAIDELDYYRLQQQVQGVTWHEPEDTSGDGTEHEGDDDGLADNTDVSAVSSTIRSKRRSMVWEYFTLLRYTEEKDSKTSKAQCNYCSNILSCHPKNGTSALHKHIMICKQKHGASDQPRKRPSVGNDAPSGNSVAAGNSVGRKRMRSTEESTQHVTAKHWNKAYFSDRIQQFVHHLQEVMTQVVMLHGPDSFAGSNVCWSTTSDSHLVTSALSSKTMYGRVAEKNFVVKLMTEHNSDDLTVLPIVGIGGIGKTTLAQHIYNDPIVECQFQHRIWAYVSNNFDQVQVTREMLDFICQENHERSCSFAKLQESLRSNIKSKRFLLVLDDVWDDSNIFQWDKLLSPLKSNNAKGNMILVTTRSLSVAKRVGTVEAIKLGALEKEDSWLLFKSCAFGDENHEPSGVLNTVGQKLTDKLEHNPLAIETAGELLSENHTVDHWNEILKNEDWKSLLLSGGIMRSLKRSYDQLPYHLQQCFLYCSIFPRSYRFLGEDLVRIWISQGFVKRRHSNKRLEEIGEDYLTLLVNSGFFQQEYREEFSSGNKTCYAMCGLMHDFARLISRTYSATIDGPECTKILPTIRHLSILTESAFCKDQDGNIIRNKRFEERLQSLATSVNKVRTLVLIGQYDHFFFQSFLHVFQKAQNLGVLHIDAKYADFNSFLCKMVNYTHLRYIKLRAVQRYGALPQILSKFYHLQVLDVGSNTNPVIPNGVNNLVSLRHLVAQKGVCSSITSIGKMTSLQELHDFSVRNVSGFEIAQLQSMSELVNLGVYRLERVRSQQEACGARLKDKQLLEKLHLSWRDANDGHDSDTSFENEYDSDDMIFEPSMDIETQIERLPMCYTNGSPSSEHFPDRETAVLDGLEPHDSLKNLLISGYSGVTTPTWLASSLICLQTLHLENCRKWLRLPLERLCLLRKLVLIKMRNLTQVSIPSLEELVLIELPSLKKCSCTSVRDLNSTLRVLKIKHCPVLEVFPLFENYQQFEIEQPSWLSHLTKLTIHGCHHLHVPNPLPPSTIVSKLSIGRVSTLPTVEGSSIGTLRIGLPYDDCFDEDSDHLIMLDDKVLSFHNLRFLTELVINGCKNLTSISFKSLGQLICLKRLEIKNCPKLISSNVPLELTHEDMAGANHSVIPSLECLVIVCCGITGKWLSLLLQHAQALRELRLYECEQITGLSIGDEENSQPNLISATEAPSSLGYPGRDKLLYLPFNLILSLRKVSIACCSSLTFYGSKEGLAGFSSLEKLEILGCPKLLSSLVHNDGNDEQANGRWLLSRSLRELEIKDYNCLETLQPCFPGNLTRMKKLEVLDITSLTSLQLQSCTALEDLTIKCCRSLAALEGLQFLHALRHLEVYGCSSLPPYLESLSGQGYELCSRLQRLKIDDPSILTTSFCKHLTSLQCLELFKCEMKLARLTDEQERALQFLVSLQELRFGFCYNLIDLPVGLHSLPSLKRLEIWDCKSITRLPEKGLPPSLEELDIYLCSDELAQQCRTLASKLKVKINW